MTLPDWKNRGPQPDVDDWATSTSAPVRSLTDTSSLDTLNDLAAQARNGQNKTTNPLLTEITRELTSDLGELNTYLAQVRRDQVVTGPLVEEGEMQIGIVRLTIPPEKVEVREIPQNIEVPGLRTDGSTIIKSGKGRIQITLSLVFNGRRDVNTKFRKLLAQFRSFPYVPVISPYLARIVQPKLQKDLAPDQRDQLEQQISSVIQRIGRRVTDIDAKLLSPFSNASGAIAQDADVSAALKRFRDSPFADTLQEVDAALDNLVNILGAKSHSINKDSLRRNPQILTIEAQLANQLDQLKLDIIHLQHLRQARVQAEVGGAIDSKQSIVPCVLDHLTFQSEPGRSDLIRAQLTLMFFNTLPYGGILRYKDLLGQPTLDPNAAVFFNDHLSKKWLAGPESTADFPQAGAEFKRVKPIKSLARLLNIERDQTITMTYAIPQFRQRNPNEQAEITKDPLTIPDVLDGAAPTTEEIVLGGDDSTVRHVSLAFGNRLALQPIPGEVYPSAQYLGANPGRVTVVVDTTNKEFIEKLHRMKRANQLMSTLGVRHWRRTEVHVRNPFINLGGVWTVQLDDIVTESISAQLTRMTIQMFEHSVDLEEREAVFRNSIFSVETIYDTLKFMFENAVPWGDSARYFDRNITSHKAKMQDAVKRLNVQREGQGKLPLDPRNYAKIDDEATSDRLMWSKASYDLLFGTRDKDDKLRDAIITQNIIQRAFFLDPSRERDGDPSKTEENRAIVRTTMTQRHLPLGRLLAEDAETVAKRTKTQSRKAAEKDAETIAQVVYAKYRGIKLSQYAAERADPNAFSFIVPTGHRGSKTVTAPNPPNEMYTPDDDELRLLAEYLSRSSGNSGDEVRFDEESGKVKVIREDGSDATEDVTAVLTLLRAVMNDLVVPPVGLSLHESVLGAGHTFQDFLREEGQRKGVSRLYPDLDLPTYQTMLEPLLTAFAVTRRGNGDGTVTFKSVEDFTERERQVIKNFIPTYEQVGQIPPVGTSNDDLAYDLFDTVLPDFVFFSQTTASITAEGDRGADVVLGDAIYDRKRRSDGFLDSGAIHDPLRSAVLTKIFTSEPGETPPRQLKESTESAPALGSGVVTDQHITESYKPARARGNFTDFGKETRGLARDIYAASSKQREDNQLSLRRCFPTIRLFFIEEDQGEGIWRAVDDIYGFNSIVEAHITRHKYQPDLAEFTLTNLQGNLEYDKFSTPWRDSNEGPIVNSVLGDGGRSARTTNDPSAAAGPTEPGTRERVLRKFPLAEGTRIVIQLGYHSRTDFMKTVFTGKIAEVTQGDLVKVIAQGYLAELLYPMTSPISGEAAYSVIKSAMDSPTVAHFGKWTPLSSRMFSTSQLNNARDTSFLTLADKRFEAFLADPKMKNVHVANYSGWWSRTLLSFIEENWDVGDGSKTAWDVIQEITNYSPGYIAAVVPYDLEATLFVGRPEQVYTFTDGLRDQERNFNRNRARDFERAEEFAGPLLQRYLSSREFRGPTTRLPTVQSNIGNIIDSDEFFSLMINFPFWTLFAQEFAKNNHIIVLLDEVQTADGKGRLAPITREKIREAFRIIEQQRAGTDLSVILDRLGDGAYPIVISTMINGIRGSSRGDTVRPPASDPRMLKNIIDRLGEDDERLKVFESGERALSALTKLPDPVAFFSEIWNGTTVRKEDINKAMASRSTIWELNVSDLDMIRAFLWEHRFAIPNILASMAIFIDTDPLAAVRAKFELRRRNRYPFNPRNKPFRNYHIVTSLDDLIENQMSCTRSGMWNGVAISSGSDRPLILWADDGIIKQDRILRYFHEPNADIDLFGITSDNAPSGLVNNKYLAGVTRLAQGMRMMYRGQLLLRGRPEIKPWDVVYVYDHYNQISGPVEVERVTHHFTAQTGLVTTITPHAVVVPNNQIDTASIMAHGIATGIKYSGLVVGAAVAGTLLIGLFTGGIGLAALGVGIGAGVGTKTVVDFLLKETTGTDIAGNFVGVGRHGGLRMPVKIIPLSRQNVPWLAALRGFGRGERNDIGFVLESLDSRFRRRVEDAWSAGERRVDALIRGIEAFDDLKSQSTKARKIN